MALSAGVWLALLALQRADNAHGASGRLGSRLGRRHSRKEEHVIRKHTRRAAKAAFAISLGVAIVFGLDSPATARPAHACGADDRHRHEELPRGVHPRRALQAGARGEGLQRLLQGEHRLDRDHPDGADEREDQLLPRVHGRDRAGRLPQDELAEDGRGDLRSSRSSSRRRRATRSSTRRRSTTRTCSR